MSNRPAPHDPLPVTVRVFDIAADEEIRKLEFKYNNKKSRAKLFKTMFWALCQGHAIEVLRTADDTPL